MLFLSMPVVAFVAIFNDNLQFIIIGSLIYNCILCRLVIKGDQSEYAVVCTDSETYELKNAETSNSLLVLPECRFPEEFVKEKDECGDGQRRIKQILV